MSVYLVVLSGSGIHLLEYSGSTINDNNLIYLLPISCLIGMTIETISLYDINDVNHIPDNYTVPYGYNYGHLSNRAFFEIYANGIYIGDSLMNNNSGSTSSGILTQSGKYVCGDYFNTPDWSQLASSGIWSGSSYSRYSSMKIDAQQAYLIEQGDTGLTTVTFDFVPTMIAYSGSCDSNINPEYGVTWIRMFDINNNLIYNGLNNNLEIECEILPDCNLNYTVTSINFT